MVNNDIDDGYPYMDYMDGEDTNDGTLYQYVHVDEAAAAQDTIMPAPNTPAYVNKTVASRSFTMSTPDLLEPVVIPDFTLIIPLSLYNVLLYLRQEAHPYEFAFEGVVDEDIDEDRTFRLRKIYIPRQTATKDSVIYDVETNTIAPEDELPNLTLHGHSHVDMPAGWSPKDECDIEDWMGGLYRINLVMNNFGILIARIDFFASICADTFHVGRANVNVVIEFPDDFEKVYSDTAKRITKIARPITRLYPHVVTLQGATAHTKGNSDAPRTADATKKDATPHEVSSRLRGGKEK